MFLLTFLILLIDKRSVLLSVNFLFAKYASNNLKYCYLQPPPFGSPGPGAFGGPGGPGPMGPGNFGMQSGPPGGFHRGPPMGGDFPAEKRLRR